MQRLLPRFRSEEYFVYEITEEMFYPNLQRFVWRRHAGAHLVCRAPRYCRITALLYELHWLPVRQRISFRFYYLFLTPSMDSGNYNLRSSSDSLLLATPTYRSRVTLGDRSFQVAAPALWNVLPREIRSITDLGIFKCHLKTHLFREAFY